MKILKIDCESKIMLTGNRFSDGSLCLIILDKNGTVVLERILSRNSEYIDCILAHNRIVVSLNDSLSLVEFH